MRKISFFLSFAVVILMSVALVEGQQPAQKKGGFGFGGGFGGGPGQMQLNLLNNKDVKAELEITDAQMEKLPAEVLLAISKVLNDKQFKRFKQIELQQRGNRVFKDEAVQTALKINDEQKKNINSIIEDAAKDIAEARKAGGGFGGFGKGNEKIEKINSESKDKILTVLTKDQRKAWRALVGEEFKMTTPTFGGFGGFGKGKDAKKDPPKDK